MSWVILLLTRNEVLRKSFKFGLGLFVGTFNTIQSLKGLLHSRPGNALERPSSECVGSAPAKMTAVNRPGFALTPRSWAVGSWQLNA